MKTKMKISRSLCVLLALTTLGVLAWPRALAQHHFDPGPGLTPELVVPVVTNKTKIHLSGSFTCIDAVHDSAFIESIEIRVGLRFMEQDGAVTVNNLTLSGAEIALDPSDPSGRRLAFRTVIDLATIFGDDQGIRSASLFFDATVRAEKGGRQPRTSLGSFTAGALVRNEATMVEYCVQMSPQRDSIIGGEGGDETVELVHE